MEFKEFLEKATNSGKVPPNIHKSFCMLYASYQEVFKATKQDPHFHDQAFITFLTRVIEQVQNPFVFEPYHKMITSPFNYYEFGIDFLRPLVDEDTSLILKIENISRMEQQLKAKENVVLFANHQTEVDPQLISYVLEKEHHELAFAMIFVAGDRVINDPLAVPFSMGRNLLCIYSKRYIDNPPEKRMEKQHHNHKVMRRLAQLFVEGGKCVFVAPSGGRDRPNEKGDVEPAPFDPAAIEMFRLMAKQGSRPTHFYPLALDTYKILPPPDTIKFELGEKRIAHRDGIRFAFGDEIDLDLVLKSESHDRRAQREKVANHIWNLVNTLYETIKKRRK